MRYNSLYMRTTRKNISNKGFSLIELSIVIVIVGILLAGAVSLGTASLGAAKVTDTEKKMATIQNALQLYFEVHGYLPCPSDPRIAIGAAGFGDEDCASPPIDSLNVLGGGVPTVALNLPTSYAFDGWGNRFSLFFDVHCSDGSSSNWAASGATISPAGAYCTKTSATSVFTINDANAHLVTNTAVYILISHGKNGQGAWNRGGTARNLPITAGTKEKANSDATGAATVTYIDAPNNDGDVTASYFDDIVRWQTDDMMYYCRDNAC
jgi:prepilin-type N-terminal cleavage/methylation domain-containing protein